ncbi:preprotein translocase subunit SecG [Candidatus Microgenomates bacterium]|nr:preprotein translocase subunit SecG [Candidatus Microgenomates bacterium]
MNVILNTIQILVSMALIVVILVQTKGGGLGTSFGQSQEMFRTKRGVERIFHLTTIFLSCLFLITSILSVLVK